MADNFKNTKGNSLIELTMVMMLLILFGLTIFTIISASSKAQQKIMANKDAQIDARIALTYVGVKIRQNDEANKISVVKNPETGENSILISSRTDDNQSDTWIFHHNNGLYEFLGLPGELPSVDLSFAILESDDMDYSVEFNEDTNSIKNTVIYKYGTEKKELSAVSYLRVSSDPDIMTLN